MLTSTFIHAPGIGEVLERRLWQQGARTWDDFLADSRAYKLPEVRRAALVETLLRSREALSARDYRYFAQSLKLRDHWRAVDAFRDSVAYLDIETTGTGGSDQVTLIGLYDGERFQQFVRGENLLEFLEVIDTYRVLVTFFGAGFDLPVLQSQFSGLRFPHLHVDLCFLYRRLGLKGGLKSIERQLGLERSPDTRGLSGWDAVRLWWEYQHGNPASLETLLRYNAEDVLNLEHLLNHGLAEMTRRCLGDGVGGSLGDRAVG